MLYAESPAVDRRQQGGGGGPADLVLENDCRAVVLSVDSKRLFGRPASPVTELAQADGLRSTPRRRVNVSLTTSGTERSISSAPAMKCLVTQGVWWWALEDLNL
jgi:hypothetical protein